MAFGEFREAEFQRKLEDGTTFPLLLTPLSEQSKAVRELAEAVGMHREWLDSALSRSGAILFRGFDVNDANDFNLFVEAWGGQEFPYIGEGGKATRRRVGGRVLTVNENVPLEKPIGFHNEASYMEVRPTRLIFFCEVAPPKRTGGETAVVHGSVVCKRVREECSRFVEKSQGGIKLVKKGDSSPQSTGFVFAPFGVDGAGRQTWFNGMGYYAVTLREEMEMVYAEGGDMVSKDDIDAVLKIMEEEMVAVSWEKGDVLVLDNTAVQHSRSSCSFAGRRILISLVK